MEELTNRIFQIKDKKEFERISLEVFSFQYNNNPIYNQWCNLLNRGPKNVKSLTDIPFLPISFFKTHRVVSFKNNTQLFFKSSGTTSSQTSKHYIYDIKLYEKSFTKSFETFFQKPENYCFIALLPNYISQENSSLIYMIDQFIRKSKYKESGFYNQSLEETALAIRNCEARQIKTILFGVSYALMDLVEKEKFNLKHTIVFETGGMKGKRKEIVRQALHKTLSEGFGTNSIASEYGMCELFSQAYSKQNGIFQTPNWMKILIRDTYNPLEIIGDNKTGAINVIDLANLYSCSFIATEDLGKSFHNNSFEVLGRIDNTTIRGCNLLYEN